MAMNSHFANVTSPFAWNAWHALHCAWCNNSQLIDLVVVEVVVVRSYV